MNYPFTLAAQSLTALPSGAIHWPAQNLLCVSDLHLGKSLRMARRGGSLLPPYEVTATLTKLDADITATGAKHILCLGDSFDDAQAETDLTPDHRIWLTRLMAGRAWTWIAGNHDPAPLTLGGTNKNEATIGPLTFRHIADPAQIHDISGHYHPKARLKTQSRPCFLLDKSRLIMPAYGTYTGGLWADDAAFKTLITPPAIAILTGSQCLALPLTSGSQTRRLR
ncbi:ligase-associated DNA damage response endonuclease PdeM [Pseudorhodobacter antarcticus]|jgi:hypothetical protein|nr:ligase-associated DNA damage response endonuclease PdeM [Pseudorhodobacter antarcticus]